METQEKLKSADNKVSLSSFFNKYFMSAHGNSDYEALEKKHNDLIKSINRAGKIQSGLMSEMDDLQAWIKDCFLFYSVKDIVSGDLYWWRRIDNKVFIAIGDCTGHGIPGAFMSIVAHIKLKMLVTSSDLNTHEILSRLNQEIIGILKQDQGESQESVDMGICCIDLNERKLQFSGAYRSLIFLRNGELQEIQGDKFSVGGCNKYFEKNRNYTLHEMYLREGDVFYLCSDGFQDQFGNEGFKKYGSKQFKNFLKFIHQLPFDEQQRALEYELYNWKGDAPQTDDITVFGFKL